MSDDYAQDATRRNLQLEARAHIEVQQLIDHGKAPAPMMSVAFLLWVHREFCQRLPDELLRVENPDTGECLKVIPGQLRETHGRVGRHIPPAPADLPAFLDRLTAGYTAPGLGRLRRIMAVPLPIIACCGFTPSSTATAA